jgi:NAD(P)-dependent dehydrogenase (short-subunit alcohol dehydrogenase family)
MQFATNHLGHFALALDLQEALKAAGGARIVSVSSVAHLRSPVDFEDLHFRWRPYDPMQAYGQSKTANVLFAVEATRRWKRDGIIANALHPGAIQATKLSRHLDPDVLDGLRASGIYDFKTPEQGAATSVLLATAPQFGEIGGRYFEHCNEAEVVDAPIASPGGSGVARYGLDGANAKRLWDISENLIRSCSARRAHPEDVPPAADRCPDGAPSSDNVMNALLGLGL